MRARPPVLALAAAAAGLFSGVARADSLLLDEQGLFGRVRVEEHDGLRTLSLGDPPTPQSAGRPDDPSWLEYEYTRIAMAALLLGPEPARVLVVGLGGGSMPRFLRWLLPRATIDAVELDPAVARAAKSHFGLVEDRLLRVHVDDGRALLERSRARWDLILLDAYAPDYIPPALATLEFFRLARSHLTPAGVVVANVWGPPNPRFGDVRRTLVEAFGTVLELEGRVDANHLFFAPRAPRPFERATLEARASGRIGAHPLPFDLAELLRGTWRGPVPADAPGELLHDAPAQAPRRPVAGP